MDVREGKLGNSKKHLEILPLPLVYYFNPNFHLLYFSQEIPKTKDIVDA